MELIAYGVVIAAMLVMILIGRSAKWRGDE